MPGAVDRARRADTGAQGEPGSQTLACDARTHGVRDQSPAQQYFPQQRHVEEKRWEAIGSRGEVMSGPFRA